MQCPVCLRPIDDSRLACAYCAAAKSYQALLASQKPLVAHILQSKCTVKATKPFEEKYWHVAIADYAQAWCGRTLDSRWKKKRLTLAELEALSYRMPTCEGCRRMLEKIAEAQSSEAA